MSKIYLVDRGGPSKAVYDTYNHHVIVANSPAQAREFAMEIAADEGEQSWIESKVTVIGTPNDKFSKPGIVLSDFNAG